MDTKQLIKKAQEQNGNISMRELATKMGINHTSLSLLGSGKGELSDDTYVKLAKLAGVDPVQVLIEKHARKAGPEAAPLWKQIQKHLPKSAAIAVIAVCAMPLIPEKAQANQSYNIACSLNKHYANQTIRHTPAIHVFHPDRQKPFVQIDEQA
ncbi:helix-turn-helix domain-containing protein [Acidithiobacillus thiooxidans]|uniref:HTH cro/C1-type domain-containing protein n=1 Tax=Acidithiobacillus thiooxidans TaxID=930 RepID=A0A1C2IK57_ACITH|nr:helix-turn-helix transcriptional regulator [Acidithiobacillus thiooxidans]OCX76364.1 hypothetical protein A6M23_00580 [Acidithiobacillus thiooxidans]OCX79163.1 hypothetical protein A6P08_18415 [Acidithiobacillus thiooxidans]